MKRLAAFVAVLLIATPAAASETDALRSALEQRYPVQVLRLDAAEHDGRAVHVAIVMVLPGDYSDAMRVERLMIDAATGALVAQPRPAAGGPDWRTGQEGMERLARQ